MDTMMNHQFAYMSLLMQFLQPILLENHKNLYKINTIKFKIVMIINVPVDIGGRAIVLR